MNEKFIIINRKTKEIVCWTDHYSCVDKYEYTGYYTSRQVKEVPEGIRYEKW